MKYLIALSMLLAFSSCGKWKEWRKSKNHTHTIEHHYHDSTIVDRTERVTQIKTAPDSTQSQFNLADLIERGSMRTVDRYFTTEIRYLDSTLFLNITIDSLLATMHEMEERILQISASNGSEVETKSKDKVVESHRFNYSWIALLVIAIAAAALFAWRKGWFKNPSSSE